MHRAGHECVAVTVDHRLREASADDAAFVAQVCTSLCIPHRTVARPERADWHHQKAAREGRYDALLAVAREYDAAVVVAHTLDDQAETVRMRARRGGGTLGLAGIPPVATLAGATRLLRPLLGASRSELRLHLAESGLDWVDDPSNADMRFERARARRGAERGCMRLIGRFADAARAHRAALMAHVAADLGRNLRVHGDRFRYRPSITGTPLVHAVRWVAAWLGRSHYLPPQDRVARFVAAEKALTIAGATIARRGDAFHFAVEKRREAAFRHDPDRWTDDPFDRFRPASDDPVHEVLARLA